MTDRQQLDVPIELPTLRAGETFKVEATGYVALELLDRINSGRPSETLEVSGTFEDFDTFDFRELDRWTIEGEDGTTTNWFWRPGGGDSVDFEAGKTYALVEIVDTEDGDE